MAFNYSKLRGRIIEKYGSQTDFAKAFGCSDRTLSLKMTGKRPWKQVEILKAIKLLDLSEDDIQDYKQKIIGLIEKIENTGTLEYLYSFIENFLKRWG